MAAAAMSLPEVESKVLIKQKGMSCRQQAMQPQQQQ
jgi:hypothetical protein